MIEAMLCDDDPPARLAALLSSTNSWWLEQKLDGERVLLRVDDGEVLDYSRSGHRRSRVLIRQIEREFEGLGAGSYIFDGELVNTHHGYSYHIFDMPFVANDGGATLIDCADQLVTRRAALELVFEHWRPDFPVCLMRTERTEAGKRELAEAVRSLGGEGVVLKNPLSTYQPGKRSRDWVKVKFTKTIDCVIDGTGFEGRENAMLKVFDDNGNEVRVGRCSTVGKPPLKKGDVVEIRYLYARNAEEPRLYQPRLLRIRDDKQASECLLSQIQFTDRTVL